MSRAGFYSWRQREAERAGSCRCHSRRGDRHALCAQPAHLRQSTAAPGVAPGGPRLRTAPGGAAHAPTGPDRSGARSAAALHHGQRPRAAHRAQPARAAQRHRVERPNEVWAADITYVPTDEGWLYLAGVLDLGSRRLVGWAMGESLETSLPMDALQMALRQRQPEGLGCSTIRTEEASTPARRTASTSPLGN